MSPHDDGYLYESEWTPEDGPPPSAYDDPERGCALATLFMLGLLALAGVVFTFGRGQGWW